LIENKSFGLQITTDRMNLMKHLKGKSSGFRIIDLMDELNEAAGTRVEIEYEF
jgi:hypothetical protein